MLKLFKQKTYEGVLADYISGAANLTIPGLVNMVSGNVSLTDLVGECIADFLTGCGCPDIHYDNENHWVYIFGVPVLFYVPNSSYGTSNHRFVNIYTAFNTSIFSYGQMQSLAVSYSTRTVPFTFVFKSDNSYKISMRAVGGNESFFFVFGSYLTAKKTTTSAGYPSSYTVYETPVFNGGNVAFIKTKDLFRNLNGIACWDSFSTKYVFIDVGEDGNPISVGTRSTTALGAAANFVDEIALNENFDSFGGKLCLLKERWDYFELECYCRIKDYKLPSPNNPDYESQVFITVNGETYYVGPRPIRIAKVTG